MKSILRYIIISGILLSLLTVGISWTETTSLRASSTPRCGDATELSDGELANLVNRHFPDGIVPQTGENIRVTAYAVARAESGGNPSACGDIDLFAPGTKSVGLWQVNTYWNPEYSEEELFDPDFNAEVALKNSDNGTDWNNWCTWEETACGGEGNKAYKAYLSEAKAALGESEGGVGGCFIATVAYASYMDSSVQTLRSFRDDYMVTNPVGRSLVSVYYKLSPPIAEFMDDHPTLKPVVRIGLLPALAMSEVIVSTTSAEKMAIVGLLVVIGTLAAVFFRQRVTLG